MRHIAKTIATLTFFAIVLGNLTQAYAGGAYMYCVNSQNTNEWKWAHWKFKGYGNSSKDMDETEIMKQRDNFQNSNNYVWLDGGLAYINNHPTLAVMGYEHAELCAALTKICTDEYGSDYKYIGAGNGSAVSGWNGISFYSNGGWKNEGHTCPNWWTPTLQ